MSYALLQNQIGIFESEQLSRDGSNYNLQTLTRLDPDIDISRLKKALDAAALAHPYLSARLIRRENQDIRLELFPEESFETAVFDTDDIRGLKNELDHPYDFFNDRLFRLEIYRTPEGNYLYTNFSHLIMDGWSYQLFFKEVSRAYNGESLTGEDDELLKWHETEEAIRKSEAFEKEKNWYLGEFSAFDEADSLPLPDRSESDLSFLRCSRQLELDETALNELTGKLRTTKGTVFMAAFALTLSKFSGDSKVLFNTIYHGRGRTALKNALGMLVKTLPAAIDFKNMETVEEALSALRAQNLKARECLAYGLADLSRDGGIKSDVLFAYQENFHHFELDTDGRLSAIDFLEEKSPGLVFCTEILKTDKGYEMACTYPAHRYSRGIIENFMAACENILREFTVKTCLRDIETAGKAQLKALDCLNTGAFAGELGKRSLVSLFRECAGKYPDMPAVVFKEKSYTFKQLDEMTDRLAAVIYEKIKGREADIPVVSILISRNENMVIAPLAVMKAGCAYQPLDPAYPAERLNFMVQDAGALLIIEEPAYKGVLSWEADRILSTDDFAGIFRQEMPAVTLPDSAPEDAMVLLYTSGSTGVPKGVVLEQRNVAVWCSWYNHYLDLQAGDNLACYASFGFDAHMSDIYPALTGGKTVHIIPEEIRLDLIDLNRYFMDHDIRSTLITTAVAFQFATNIRKSSLKYLLTGGEKLASLEPPTDYTLINLYGPTETTISVTAKAVLKKETNIPIGKGYETNKLYVADAFMKRLPVGAPGELIIAGPQVGRGYLNRPEKTAEVFIRNPFATEENELFMRAYRTGDIVRYRENGDIEFVGRRDQQVKIHGYRIELKEIEAVIREFDGITDASVQAFDAPDGSKFIAAYVCGNEKIKAEELKAFIAAGKPSYMVPSVIMQLDKIPYNVNQKVDKNALPKPVLQAESAGKKEAAPLNILEKKLKAMLSELLGTEDFGIGDELTAIGLTSINSIKLSAMLFTAYGISMNAFDLLDGASLQTIENKILEKLMAADEADAEKSDEADAEKAEKKAEEKTEEKPEVKPLFGDDLPAVAPLSFSQQGVYSECLASPDSTFYNIAYCLHLPEGTGINELKEAVRCLYKNHPVLHSRFTADESQHIIQMDMPDFEPDIPVLDLSPEELDSYRKAFVRPFDLEKGPLARFEIVRAGELYLLMDVHHLAADGASVDIMLSELCRHLDGKELSPELDTAFDFAAKQVKDEANEAFFDQLMGGVEEASQLIPDVYEKNLSHTEGMVSVPTDLAGIRDYAGEHGVTPASVYLAAAFLTIGRFICEDQVAIATISSGRSNVRLMNTVGMFVNTLPLASHLDNNEKCGDFISRTAELFTSVIRHENHPFADIAAKYDFKPQISYAYQVGVISHYKTRRGKIDLTDLGSDRAKLPLSIQIFGDEENSGFIRITYDKALFSQAFAGRFARSLELAAKGLMRQERVGDISLTDEADWKVLDSYNQEMLLDYDSADSVVSRFKKAAALYPDKPAAIYKNKSYTYRELDEITDRLAAVIYRRVCGITGREKLAEQVVSVIISRSEYVFLLPLAILKSGCGYEPLDPGYPKERLNFMVQDASAALLIGEASLVPVISDYQGEVLLLEDLEKEAEKLETYQLPPAPSARDLMIMLYTSGSTGTPKGCQIEHGNMVAFAYGSSHEGFYTTDGRTASFASFGFDVCMSDTFCTLLNGATLCVIPEEIRMNLNELAAYFNEMGITQVLLTTQVGVQFVQNYPQMETLRYLVMGGEKLPPLDPTRLNYTIVNGYGPTENCCGVSLFPIRFWEPNVPIGRPMVTIAGYVLDRSGHRLPAGAAGEFCLCGPQVTRGYLNRPDKTKEAYTSSPFNRFRMYHTGDIVRYRENGDVEFVGRKDGQVKIRGFRVETKEVEAVIREYPGILDATVQAYSYESGGKYLAAFIVSDREIDISDLNQFIKDRKPAYMVPLVTMRLDKIPLTVNQKVDRKALPKPEVKKAGYEAPKNKAEEDFCSIFSRILDIEKVGAADDFFELGGSSISAMRVVVAANQLGYAIVYQNVFENTTPKALAAFAGGSSHLDEVTETVRESREGDSFYGSGTSEIGPDGYNYHDINALLRKNSVEAFRKGERQPVRDVLLCGATGYLGIHVLKELIKRDNGRIYCLVRGREDQSGEERLKTLLHHYFGEDFASLFGTRIFVFEGDASDPKALENCRIEGSAAVINCAASVKHFARGDEIERANLEIVRNLVDWCLKNKARLVHVSTESIFGHPSHGVPGDGFIYDEHMLYVGQIYEDNQYVRSKFLAERLIYEAMLKEDLNAKVLRAGNLAPRDSDGIFQINAGTNNYMNTLKGFGLLGMIPYEAAVSATEFSPIDKVAEALVHLAETPRECVCFMMSNNHRPLMGDVIEAMSHEGFDIRYVENEEFASALQEALKDPALIDAMRPFMAYALNEQDTPSSLGLEALSVAYTSEILARFGFFWPVCTEDYCRRFLRRL